MRLQVGVITALVAAAITTLLVVGDEEEAAFTGKAPQQPAAAATIDAPPPEPTPTRSARSLPPQPSVLPSLPEPAASPWLQPPTWVSSDSSQSLRDYYYQPSIVDVVTGELWHVFVPESERDGTANVSVTFLGWTPAGEGLVEVSSGERAALYTATPGEAFRYLMTADAGGRPVLSSPDGLLLAVGRRVFDTVAGELVTELPEGTLLGWSADSTYFAVADASGEPARVLAWGRDLGEVEELLSTDGGVWSSSGHRFAYAPVRREATEPRANQVFVKEFGEGDDAITVLAEFTSLAASPVAWSYDDRYLAVAVSQPLPDGAGPAVFYRDPDIHIADARTGRTGAVVRGAWVAGWSPTTHTLLFTGNICNGLDIFTVEADGSGLTNYTNSEGTDIFPIWAPDGEQAAFVSLANPERLISIASVQTGTVRSALAAPPDATYPIAWSPDSRYLAFTYGGGRGLCKGRMAQETEVKMLG